MVYPYICTIYTLNNDAKTLTLILTTMSQTMSQQFQITMSTMSQQ